MLLQTVLCGKAPKTYASLLVEDSMDYDLVKSEILKHELVPEVYCQNLEVIEKHRHVEFLKQKETL